MKILEVYAASLTPTRVPLPYFWNVVQAGRNDPDIEPVYELLDLFEHLVRDPKATFYVRVGGNSMTSAGIYDGDLLLVDCGIDVMNGDVVIVALNGEMMVKRLVVEFGITYLGSENGTSTRMEVGPQDTLDIIGLVLNSIHNHCPRIRRGV